MDASSDFASLLPTSPNFLYSLLKDLKIKFRVFEHPPFFTVDEAKKHRPDIQGYHIKNLFLRDKKKKNFLIVAQEDRIIDLTNYLKE